MQRQVRASPPNSSKLVRISRSILNQSYRAIGIIPVVTSRLHCAKMERGWVSETRLLMGVLTAAGDELKVE